MQQWVEGKNSNNNIDDSSKTNKNNSKIVIIAITVVIIITLLLLLILINIYNNNGNVSKNQVVWLKKCFLRLCLKIFKYQFSLMPLGFDSKMKDQ